MRSVEVRKGFPEELEGSRKGHEAIDVAVNRKISWRCYETDETPK